MTKLGGKTLVGDESLVCFHDQGRLICLITLHMDDIQGAGTAGYFKNVFDTLTKIFKTSKREVGKFICILT